MNIYLRSIKLESDESKLQDIDKINFSKLVEESFYEWTKLDEKVGEQSIDWSGKIFIETDDEEFEYNIDSMNKYVTSLDLDGFLNGEKIILEDDLELMLGTIHSYIYELLTYHIVRELGLIPAAKLEAVKLNLFPNWAGGYLTDDLSNNKTMEEFMSLFEPLLNEFEIIKKIKINTKNTSYTSKNRDIGHKLKKYLEEYLSKEVFFIAYDMSATNLFSKVELSRLITAGQKFNPDLEILDSDY